MTLMDRTRSLAIMVPCHKDGQPVKSGHSNPRLALLDATGLSSTFSDRVRSGAMQT